MDVSTLNCYFLSVPAKFDQQPNLLEEVSMLSFPEVSSYLDSEVFQVRDTLIHEILKKSNL